MKYHDVRVIFTNKQREDLTLAFDILPQKGESIQLEDPLFFPIMMVSHSFKSGAYEYRVYLGTPTTSPVE